MKKTIITGLALLGFAAMMIVTGSAIAGDNDTQVLIKHFTANGKKFIILAVDSETNLATHLAHGDVLLESSPFGDDTGL